MSSEDIHERANALPPLGDQTQPVPNDGRAVWDLVREDAARRWTLLDAAMHARDCLGRQRYGVPLTPHNGRDTLRDLYEELLDAAVYTRTLLYERDGK